MLGSVLEILWFVLCVVSECMKMFGWLIVFMWMWLFSKVLFDLCCDGLIEMIVMCSVFCWLSWKWWISLLVSDDLFVLFVFVMLSIGVGVVIVVVWMVLCNVGLMWFDFSVVINCVRVWWLLLVMGFSVVGV